MSNSAHSPSWKDPQRLVLTVIQSLLKVIISPEYFYFLPKITKTKTMFDRGTILLKTELVPTLEEEEDMVEKQRELFFCTNS